MTGGLASKSAGEDLAGLLLGGLLICAGFPPLTVITLSLQSNMVSLCVLGSSMTRTHVSYLIEDTQAAT